MQEFYKILNVSESATDEEIEIAYKKLKEKYSRERFYEGEIGNEAARMLTKIETAYHEITEQRKHSSKSEKSCNDFSEVEKLIKSGNISGAQIKLDDYTERNAEWHYLQSVIFYKKNWMSESKKQLEIAVNMEPYNQKYTEAYSKLKQKMEFNDRQFYSGNAHYSSANPSYEQRQMGETDNGCLSFCTTWCCMNLMCNMCCR